MNVIPWIEESFDGQYGWLSRGMKDWETVVDTVIVSTIPGRADLYTRLQHDFPMLNIIPGLKPNGSSPASSGDLLPAFDGVSGWQGGASEVQRIRDAANADTIILELEKAGLRCRNLQEEFDESRFAKCLRELPDDLNYIWYPSIKAHGFEYLERHSHVCEIAASVLGKRVRFTDRSVESPAALDDWWMVQAHKYLLEISMEPTLPMAYCYEEGKILWAPEELPTLFEHVENEWGEDADLVLYPGGSNWNTGAKEIVPALAMYDWLRR